MAVKFSSPTIDPVTLMPTNPAPAKPQPTKPVVTFTPSVNSVNAYDQTPQADRNNVKVIPIQPQITSYSQWRARMFPGLQPAYLPPQNPNIIDYNRLMSGPQSTGPQYNPGQQVFANAANIAAQTIQPYTYMPPTQYRTSAQTPSVTTPGTPSTWLPPQVKLDGQGRVIPQKINQVNPRYETASNLRDFPAPYYSMPYGAIGGDPTKPYVPTTPAGDGYGYGWGWGGGGGGGGARPQWLINLTNWRGYGG